MKILITIVSSLVMGIISAANDFSSIAELHSLLANKRRLLWSGILGAAGFFLVMSAIVTAGIEGALQFEVQGFLLWSALFSAATGFLVLGVLCAVISKLLIPKPAPPVFDWSALEEKFQIRELLEKWVQSASSPASNSARTDSTTSPEPPSGTDIPPMTYREREAATQFSHH